MSTGSRGRVRFAQRNRGKAREKLSKRAKINKSAGPGIFTSTSALNLFWVLEWFRGTVLPSQPEAKLVQENRPPEPKNLLRTLTRLRFSCSIHLLRLFFGFFFAAAAYPDIS